METKPIGKNPSTEIGKEEDFPKESSGREPVCEEAPYPRYEPGIYDAECLEANTYRDPRFRAWKCRLKFSLLPDGGPVYGFFHLGRRDNPHAGRGSKYHRAWTIANDKAPMKRQTLSSRIFTKKIFQVEVSDVAKSHDGRVHHEAAVYSTVKQILSRIYP